jgi:HK97 family phage portal protein
VSLSGRIMQPRAATTVDIQTAMTGAVSGVRSGVSVTPDSAMRVSAVYACVRVLAESVAQLPLIVYEKRGEKRVRAKDYPLYSLLHDAPNEFQTSFEFREMMQGHLALRGNAYARIVRNRAAGGIVELLPLHPDSVQLEEDNYKIQYKVQLKNGQTETLQKDQVFHLKGLSSDGFTGMSPITMAREAIGLAIATERYGAQLYGNGAKPGGILKHPQKFSSKEVQERVRDSWDAFTSGDNAGKTAVLEEGMDWVKVGMTAEDSQFLEGRRFQVSEIARIFRVPTMLLQHDDKTSTYASAEQFMLSFVTHTMTPWLVRWEQSIRLQLMSEDERERYFSEFLMDGLLRGDTKSRYEAYGKAITDGWMNRNEARVKENLDPVDGLEEFLRQANMTGANDANDPQE